MNEITPEDFVNPRSHCWRLKIPFNVRKVFEDEKFYPSSWRFRQFFPSRMNHKKRRKSNVDGDIIGDK